jgi:hypothetical protein
VTYSAGFGDYNRDQWTTLNAVREACKTLGSSETHRLKDGLAPYLDFRKEVDQFYLRHFAHSCRKSCFETDLSACCGFESIITFFADHAINFLLSSQEEILAILHVLEQRNETGKCVYLGKSGCLWRVRPISCGMFLCGQVKEAVFGTDPAAESVWQTLQAQEKDFTWPTKPVLFDEMEKLFLRLGVESPHLLFHQSPGLLRLKAEAGL